MTIYLIRHTSVDVPRGTCYGHTDVSLRDTFEAEAALTKEHLQGVSFDCVYTSPLTRATRLATFCGYPHALRDNRLKELDFGDWEMQLFDEIKDPRLQEWYADYYHVAATHGESFVDLYRRVSSFLDELRTKPYQQVAIFAHGGVLICAQVYAGILTKESAWDSLTPYGGVIKVELG